MILFHTKIKPKSSQQSTISKSSLISIPYPLLWSLWFLYCNMAAEEGGFSRQTSSDHKNQFSFLFFSLSFIDLASFNWCLLFILRCITFGLFLQFCNLLSLLFPFFDYCLHRTGILCIDFCHMTVLECFYAKFALYLEIWNC